jgi:glyoxylase-like metal-dependent hydrolase (beta-lactamase superfamily II)
MSEQPPLPLITNDPVEVSQDIYVIPDGGVPLVPNVGIVAGARAALVVDTGMGPASGNTVRRHAEALAGGRRLYLTITHFHPEHGFGAQSFTRDATIVYNIDQLQAGLPQLVGI